MTKDDVLRIGITCIDHKRTEPKTIGDKHVSCDERIIQINDVTSKLNIRRNAVNGSGPEVVRSPDYARRRFG